MSSPSSSVVVVVHPEEVFSNAEAIALSGFLAGYSGQTPDLDPGARAHLLRVLELDKALYEAVYEARNRPDWLSIPLDAVQRLIG